MLRLLLLAALASWGWHRLTGKWPWDYLALPPARAEIARARTLLGVSEGATRAQIIEAHKALILRVHPDKGGTSSLVHEANDARDLLLRGLNIAD